MPHRSHEPREENYRERQVSAVLHFARLDLFLECLSLPLCLDQRQLQVRQFGLRLLLPDCLSRRQVAQRAQKHQRRHASAVLEAFFQRGVSLCTSSGSASQTRLDCGRAGHAVQEAIASEFLVKLLLSPSLQKYRVKSCTLCSALSSCLARPPAWLKPSAPE